MSHEQIIQAVYTLGGVGILVGAFKSIDWLIGTKYKSKAECEDCRGSVYKHCELSRADMYKQINRDRDLLVSIDTKMDLVMENFNLKPKG